MTITWLAAVALGAVTNQSTAAFDPPPAFTSPALHEAIRVTVGLSEAGNVAALARQTAKLPNRDFVIAWDDRKVPELLRPGFIRARQEAITNWRTYSRGRISFVPAGKTADFKIAFAPQLADDPVTGVPAGVVVFDGFRQGIGEAVIGLKRGRPGVETTNVDVYNDVLYAVGSYYGLGRNLVAGSAMFPAPAGQPTPNGITSAEQGAVKQVLRYVEQLRDATRQGQKLRIGKANAVFSPGEFRGKALQGDVLNMSLLISNVGTGLLKLRMDVDCGCTVANAPSDISPGSSVAVPISIDTREFANGVIRHVHVYTNDPERPVVDVPIQLDIRPQAEFIVPRGNAIEVQNDNKPIEAFLVLAEGVDLKVTSASLSGIGGKVTFAKWSGSLADPNRGGPAKPRRGYRFRMVIPTKAIFGRTFLGLNLVTDHPTLNQLSHMMVVQRGVVALPGELFLGELGKLPVRATVTVAAAGRPVRVKSVSIDATSITVRSEPGASPSEVRIVVQYDGKAPAGDLSATITVRLDDPRQPVIQIPVTGTIR